MPVFGEMMMEGGMPDLNYDPGYLLVQQNENYLMGLIDTNGTMLIKPIYEGLNAPIKGLWWLQWEVNLASLT
ncbi:MAG: WG repeat-containing protein [Saprospiraceae bacterium]